MKQRVGMEDDEEDEDEEEEKQKAVWGRGKKIYYGADNVDREVTNSRLCPQFHRFQIFAVVASHGLPTFYISLTLISCVGFRV
jgi:hypothetical protein